MSSSETEVLKGVFLFKILFSRKENKIVSPLLVPRKISSVMGSKLKAEIFSSSWMESCRRRNLDLWVFLNLVTSILF